VRNPVSAYAASLAAVAVAIGARVLLDPLVGDRVVFLIPLAAVVFTARYCGRGPALLALVLAGLGVWLAVLRPGHPATAADSGYVIGLVVYATLGLAVIGLFESLRKARQRAEDKQGELRSEVEARRAAEERFRLASDAARALVYAVELTGSRRVIAHGLERLTGYRADEVDLTLDWWHSLIHPDDLPGHRQAVAEHVAAGRPYTSTYRVRRKEGTWIWVEATAQVVKDASGAAAHIVGTLVDITARREAEQALKDAERRKDEFLAMLAHELRNPLAPMKHALELMQGDPDDRKRLEQARSTLERQVSHMGRLVDDLLDVSRIASSKLELKKERISLVSVLRNVVETSRPSLERSGHVFTVELPADPTYLWADPVRLAQVFGNLLDNAGKYTPSGGEIRLRAQSRGAEVSVRVSDNGYGIPPLMLPRVFDLYTQADETLHKSEGGLGIGLSLVRRLVEMHGGTVSAHSEGEGRGSEFVVRLPLRAEDAVAQTRESSSSSPC
jgi:PAS domain S-box-containing protein